MNIQTSVAVSPNNTAVTNKLTKTSKTTTIVQTSSSGTKTINMPIVPPPTVKTIIVKDTKQDQKVLRKQIKSLQPKPKRYGIAGGFWAGMKKGASLLSNPIKLAGKIVEKIVNIVPFIGSLLALLVFSLTQLLAIIVMIIGGAAGGILGALAGPFIKKS